VTRLGPGPELEEAVRKGKAAYDEWEQKQNSRGCRDENGSPMTKPPHLLAGMGTGVAAERWLEAWIRLKVDHQKKCVKCRGERNVQAEHPSPEDGR